jgi:hypothetical protein
MAKAFRLFALLAFISLFAVNKGLGQEVTYLVSEEQAHVLARSTLTATARRLPDMRFDREKTPHIKGFYWFEVTANVPDSTSPLLGYFAVNEVTGDVWNPVQCKRLTTSDIRRFQEHLRKKGKITDFRRISDQAPCEP